MNDAEIKALIERLRQRTNSGHMLLTDPPRPAPDVDCHAAADLLEQHLATKQELSDFKQEVSDAVELANDRVKSLAGNTAFIVNHMQCFIIPAPKPDPLVDVLLEMELSSDLQESQHDAIEIRKALDKLGFEIREKNDD